MRCRLAISASTFSLELRHPLIELVRRAKSEELAAKKTTRRGPPSRSAPGRRVAVEEAARASIAATALLEAVRRSRSRSSPPCTSSVGSAHREPPIPRPACAASGTMADMPEQHLRQMLEQLHTELQRADTIDDRSRELLHSVLGDIEDLLERKQKRGTQPESIIERLREAVRAFETTHPKLRDAIGGVADALARMGI